MSRRIKDLFACAGSLLMAVVVMAGAGSTASAQDGALAQDAQYAATEMSHLPGTPQQLIDLSRLEQFSRPNSKTATSEIVDVSAEGFSKAIRVAVPASVEPRWLAQVTTPASRLPIKKGDTILVVYQARCLKSAAESGGGHLAGYLQLTHEPWAGFGSFAAAPGNHWQKSYAYGVAPRDYSAGEFEVTFHLGQCAQTLEIGGMMAVNLGQNVDPRQLPVTRITYAGRELTAPWREEAAARIEKYRKGDLTVRVTDAHGQPMAGAAVHVKMTRHAYQFGTFLEEPTDWQNQDGENYRNHVGKWFNRVTVPVYWSDWGWPAAKRQYLDRGQRFILSRPLNQKENQTILLWLVWT
jgi:hypothetical protein